MLLCLRPVYCRIYRGVNGRDLHGMAQIVSAKHRKGATGDVLLNFRGEFTRFENPEDTSSNLNNAPIGGGEIVGSKMNGGNFPENESPFAPNENGQMPF